VWLQRTVVLRPRARGIHLVTGEVLDAVPEIRGLRVGLAHLIVLHTSASLALNENASPDVRTDLAAWLDRAVPDAAPYFRHRLEGPDDMAAHVKSVLTGPSLTLPVADGRLALGTWQGVYLCEHRDRGGPRSLTVTLWGEDGSPRYTPQVSQTIPPAVRSTGAGTGPSEPGERAAPRG
jgi:secondary thiamine-phosphate synthase enzyme